MKKEVEEHRIEITKPLKNLLRNEKDFKKWITKIQKREAYEHYTKDSLELEETKIILSKT